MYTVSTSWGVDWLASHCLLEKQKKMKTIVNILAEMKANTLGRHLIVISSLWYC